MRADEREVFKASIVGGELKIVYYGSIAGDAIHAAADAYNRLTRSKGRASYAFVAYNAQNCAALQRLFDGASQVQHRPESRHRSTPSTHRGQAHEQH